MSSTVLLIAAVPAVVVACVGWTTRSRIAITIAAVIAASLGLLTGSPQYAGIDLLAVVIATWIAWPNPMPPPESGASKFPAAPAARPPASSPPGPPVLSATFASRPERYCGQCRTLTTPKKRFLVRPKCTNCGNAL